VHGSGGSYTRMALTLVDKVMKGTFKQQQQPTAASDGGGKRKRAESGSFSGGNQFLPSRRLNSMDSQPGFSCGGFRGGSSGGPRGGKSGFYDSSGGRRNSDSSGSSGNKRYNKSGDRDRTSGGGASGRSGRGGSGGNRYSVRY
jgi:23S rRNA pseudouridine2605 synthase